MSELKLLSLPQLRTLMLMLLHDYAEFYYRNSVFMGQNSIDLKSEKYAGYFVFSIFLNYAYINLCN